MDRITPFGLNEIRSILESIQGRRDDIKAVSASEEPVVRFVAGQREVIVYVTGPASARMTDVLLLALRSDLRAEVERLSTYGITIQPGELDYGPGYPAPTPTT